MSYLENNYWESLLKKILFSSILLMLAVLFTKIDLPEPAKAQGDTTYYISPSGKDSNSGLSTSAPWKTFDNAWQELEPGDILVLMDGVYYEAINPRNVGKVGNPITIRAQNDGMAIIDGQNAHIPVLVEKNANSVVIIEGIVARNGNRDVFNITGDHNILRRVSGYDADTDGNSRVISIGGEYNLLEDCIAAGSGRKMILVRGDHNTVRRCLADWREWDGRNWFDCWPWGEGIEIYTGNYNIIENSIAYGHTSRGAISLLAQGGESSNGNKILGTMAIGSGMDENGVPMVWGDTRPQPTTHTCVAKIYEWPQYMSGFAVTASGGIMHDNLLQDILGWGNGRYGLSFASPGSNDLNNNRVNRATIFNNGLNELTSSHWGSTGTSAREDELANFSKIENSNIENIWTGSMYTSKTGEGARLTNRYVDSVLTSEPLWPWPMEDRVQSELGISVTHLVLDIISVDDFSIDVEPSFKLIESGSTTNLTINVDSYGNFDDTVTVTASSTSGNLSISPNPFTVNGFPRTQNLSITDTHTPSFSEPLWQTVTITATDGNSNRSATINLLLNGVNVFLPLVQK